MKPRAKKYLRRLAWTLACLVTLIALFYAVENWRGARAREKARARLIAEGESFSLEFPKVPEIPREENFCEAPMIASLVDFDRTFQSDESGKTVGDFEIVYQNPETRARFLTMTLPDSKSPENHRPKFAEPLLAKPIDLAAWVKFLEQSGDFKLGPADLPPAKRILIGFEEFATLLDEIYLAAEARPRAQYHFKPGNSFLEMVNMTVPHLTEIRNFTQFLTLKTQAAIAAGDTSQARRDLLVQLRLAEACASQTTVINHMFQTAILNSAMGSIWEGFHTHAWNQDDLQWIESHLNDLDVTIDAVRALRGEMTFFLAGIEYLKSVSSTEVAQLTQGEDFDGVAQGASFLIPSGWLDQNAAKGSQILFEACIKPLKTKDFVSPRPSMAEAFASASPYHFFARLMLSAMEKVMVRSVHTQTMIDQTRVACALERHFLKQGEYPSKLSEVPTGQGIHDMFTGEPFKYQTNGDAFILYAEGWNLIDDKGKVEMSSPKRQDLEKGDWVWKSDSGIAPDSP